MRHKSFDNLLITMMCFVALFSIYMLYGAKLVNFGKGSEIKIASIVEQLKTVKRKKDFYQGWADVKQGDSLSQNDEIYTHGQSSAKIKFENGPEISLFENSLLRIKTAGKGSSLSLTRGNLIAKLSKDSPNLNIELNGTKYLFKSENANIQIEKGKEENKFLLLEGQAKLADQEILPNQVVIQNIKTGNLQIKEIPFISKFPANNLTSYFLKEANIRFSWSFTGETSPVKIQIAKDSDFNEIIYSETLDSSSHEHNFQEAGAYFWKLSSNDGIDGPIRSFVLIEEAAPILNADQDIVYLGPKSNKKVFLNWSKNIGNNFLIKIEKPDGTSELIETTKDSYFFSPSVLGKYLLSVKVQEKSRPVALWSESIAVILKESTPITIVSQTPELIEKVNYKNETTNFLLSWNGPTSSIYYKVKILKDNKILDLETEQNSIPVNLKDTGLYTWEVQGETFSGIISNKIAGKIIIKSPLKISQFPSEGAVIELDKPDQLVAFKWDKINETSKYQFELSEDPGFKNLIVDREVDANSTSTALANTGRYFWRVKIKQGDRTEFSNPVSVEIKPSPPLSRPEISPDLKIKIKYIDEQSSSFNFIDLFFSKAIAADQIAIAEWDLPSNSKAKSYTVEVYKDVELKELIFKAETEVPHVVWKGAAAGTYYWRVSYTDFWGRKTEFSKVSILSTEVELPPEIELKNPEHHAKILNLESDTAFFDWDLIENTKEYQFLISKDLDFEELVYKKQVTTNEIKINCENIKNQAGEYYWKIITRSSSSKRRRFEATCETLLRPKKSTPEIEKELSQNKSSIIRSEELKIIKSRFLKVGFFPHQISYQNKAAQYSATVDGNAINSWYLMYQTPLNMSYFQALTPSLWISRGKVFNTITFTDIEANIKAHKQQMNFSWGPIVSFFKKTLYIESNYAIKDETLTFPLAGVFIQKEFNAFTFDGEVKIGTLLNIQAGLQYRFKNNFSIGAIIDNTSVTKNDNKHSFSRYGLNLNYTFDLPETNK